MKSNLLVLVFFLVPICSCTTQRDRTRADSAAATSEIRMRLAQLSDSLRSDGLAGWIPFVENSTEFKWIAMGSTLYRDSLIARLRRSREVFNSSAVSWDSIHIEPLSRNEATLTATCTDTTFAVTGEQVVMLTSLTATLHRIEGAWKFHSVEMAELDRWRDFQKAPDEHTLDLLWHRTDSLVKSSLGKNFDVCAVLDVDDRTRNAPYRIYQMMGAIFEDQRHQLEHSYIVAIRKSTDSGSTKLDDGSVAIIRDNKVIWHSKSLIHDMGFAALPGFGDLNNDGTTDILLCTPADMRGYSENLWIISPDSSGGRLLNQVDEYGESTIVGASDTFEFTQPDPKGAKVIKASIVGEDLNRHFMYTWNGSVFMKAKSTRSASGH